MAIMTQPPDGLIVAFAGHSSGVFGAERVMLEAVHELSRLGHVVHIALPEHQIPADPWSDAGASRSFLPVVWWMSVRQKSSLRARLGLTKRLVQALPAAIGWLRRIRPHVAVTNSLAHPEVALAAYLLGIPHVWYIHEFANRGEALYFIPSRKFGMRMVRLLSTKAIVNSGIVNDYFAADIPSASRALLYYGIEAPPETPHAPLATAPLNLVIMGSIAELKRQEDAIRAVALLVERGWDPRLRIVGSGHADYLSRLQRLTAELGLVERVTFVASVLDPFEEFARADLSIICSCDESFGRVTVEAMKAGVPVVGAAAGGTLELIRDGFNGYLFAPRDPVDLAERIALAAQSSHLLEELGRNAQRWSRETFDLEKFGHGLSMILQEAASRNTAPSARPIVGA